MILNHKIILLLVVSALLACQQTDETVTSQPVSTSESAPLPLVILPGFKLNELLEISSELTTQTSIQSAMSAPWYATFTLLSRQESQADRSVFEVNNCQDYLAIVDQQAEPVREHERNAFMEIIAMCRAAAAIVQAKPANTTYLQTLQFNADLPKQLPEQMALQVSSAERDKLNKDNKQQAWGDINNIDKVEVIDQYHAYYYSEAARHELQAVAAADFNNDGLQDVLLSLHEHSTEGSYFAIRLFLLTCLDKGENYVLLKEYDLY